MPIKKKHLHTKHLKLRMIEISHQMSKVSKMELDEVATY
jgi:hypothetical protein